jgi:hypothetical protein
MVPAPFYGTRLAGMSKKIGVVRKHFLLTQLRLVAGMTKIKCDSKNLNKGKSW